MVKHMTVIPLTQNGVPKMRLIADDGKIITNGVDEYEIIDVDTITGWYETEVDNGIHSKSTCSDS